MGTCFFEALSSEFRNPKTSLRESGNIEDNDFVLPDIGVDATVDIRPICSYNRCRGNLLQTSMLAEDMSRQC